MKALKFIVNRNYREDMSRDELYEITRGEWKIKNNEMRESAEYAVAVAHRVVRGVYKINGWEEIVHGKNRGRWRFSGESADNTIWDACYGKPHVNARGNQNPVVPIDLNDLITDGSIIQTGDNNMETQQLLELLKQFHQIILYGPPGTGKTYTAKRILEALFNIADAKELQGDRWDIVQFHPSYNYEDFVRGIQVKTHSGQEKQKPHDAQKKEEKHDSKYFSKNQGVLRTMKPGEDRQTNETTETNSGQLEYKTINRIFGYMCKLAEENPKTDYALIIDEINRANVSAVLGELIYALEYRGEPVQTPYKGNIIIPPNLYVIGTMNTADRTIGQIDYAVRRRFAFIPCPPNESIINDSEVKTLFVRVNKIFDNNEYMSSDFDAADVRIGHSYFLPKKNHDNPQTQYQERKQIAQKIIWQVVPILREYVKDGVLTKSTEPEINEIEKKAKNVGK